MRSIAALAAFISITAIFAAVPLVDAGYVTGAGSSRDAHLFDVDNGIEALVAIPEVFEGYSANLFHFILHGSNNTTARDYRVVVIVAPGSDTEASWNTTGNGPAGNAMEVIIVNIPADSIQGTLANAPFAVELRDAAGVLLDSTMYSVDLRYKEPPADGGLFQLAIATTFFWGAVLLYAFNLQRAQRKLRSKADALERSLSERGARDHDDER